MTDIEKIETQRFSDDVIFFNWWKNLIELTDIITEDSFINNKYYIRSFFIHLYELISSGVEYSYYAQSWNPQDVRYVKFDDFIKDILDSISEDEFFMITYYRNCGCHIFLSHYSWLKTYDSPQLKPADMPMKFKRKDRSFYNLTQEEIRLTVKRVIGDFGLGEDLFKRELINKLSPIIKKVKCLI